MINRAICNIIWPMSDRTYVSNTHAQAFEYFAIEIQVLRKGRLSSLNNRSSGTSTECKTLKGERRTIFIFNIITALNHNQDRGIFCPCGKDALSLPVLIK